MKQIIFILITAAGISATSKAQSSMSAGFGYLWPHNGTFGAVVEFEYEKYHSESFSLPLRTDLGCFLTPDYHTLFLEIHKGFRKYFRSGFFVEQSLGIGILSNFYTVESIWYYDDFGNTTRYNDGLNLGFTPSVTLGAGYNLTRDKGPDNLVWIRPKAFWNLGFRDFNLPYFALQIGYSHTFKTKN